MAFCNGAYVHIGNKGFMAGPVERALLRALPARRSPAWPLAWHGCLSCLVLSCSMRANAPPLPACLTALRACCSKSYLENQMSVAMGGRVAEELIFGPENVTTGASNDFQQVRP